MDPLSDIIVSLKPQSHRAAVLDLGERFSLQFPDQAGALKCNTVLSGCLWVEVEGATPVHVEAGDFFLLPLGRPFSIYSHAEIDSKPAKQLMPGEGDGFQVTIEGGGRTSVISCRFDLRNATASAFLTRLPPVIKVDQHTPDAAELSQFVKSIVDEQGAALPGCDLASQHLSQLILIKTLRLMQTQVEDQLGWLSALTHPRLCLALNAMHAHPGKGWSLDSLASQSGMSRASFARQFREHVGQTPIEYLTQWRMLLAADRLHDGQKIAQVSRALGYGSESAFSLAFKRVMGDAPRRYVASG